MNALFPRPGILDINPYVPGESKVPGYDNPIKLASNESPMGPSPKAVEAIRARLDKLHLYPDPDAQELRRAIGAAYDINRDNALCTGGSEQLLHLIARAYAGPGDEILYPQYGFIAYPLAAMSAGAKPVEAPQSVDRTDVDVLLNHVTARTKVLFLANPNNPTGTWLSPEEIKRLRDGLPGGVLLVIDEAYAEYADVPSYASALPLVEESPGNVVVARTFSKIFGLAAMRVGWGYCPPAVIDVLKRVRYSFAVTMLAQTAAIAALADTDHIASAKAHNDQWLPWVSDEISALGIEVIPSICNFVLIRLPGGADEAKAADAHLRGDGIIVRPVGGYGLPDCLRITIGTADENRKLIESLKVFRAS